MHCFIDIRIEGPIDVKECFSREKYLMIQNNDDFAKDL